MTLTDELIKLQQLKEQGALNDDEFQQAKEKVLAENRFIAQGVYSQTQNHPSNPLDENRLAWLIASRVIGLTMILGFGIIMALSLIWHTFK